MGPAVRRQPHAFCPGPGARILALLCLTAAAGGAPAHAQDRPNGSASWLSLSVPGGTAALLTAAALEPTRPRATALLDVIHVIYQEPPGADPEVDARRAAVLSYLATLEPRQRGAPTSLSHRSDSVPLPLPEPVWRGLTGTTAASPLLRAILADRQASLMYVGLCSVDAETRRYLAAHLDLLERLHASDRAPLAALFARALHVRGDRVEPPGGPAAAALWEAVAGEPLTQPERFILAVLGKDDGQLALLYDAVAHMDEARQKFALGLWIDDPNLRLSRFRALYSACALGLSAWHPLDRPFARILYDPAHVLLIARVSPDGRPGPLGWRLFWKRALGGARLPARLREGTAGVEQGGPLDAASLLEVIYQKRGNLRRDVADAWCFGERVFGAAPPASLPDVLVAVRGFERYRSLVLTLERLGIDTPAVYAAAIDRAERVAAIDDPDRAATALSLYQGALVLIERTRLARTIDAPTASGLVDSLSHLPLTPEGDDPGAVASWIDARFLPAIDGVVTRKADAAASPEARVLAAFAGRGPGLTSLRTVNYEGTRYHLDPSGVELDRIEAVRDRQRAISLDEVLAFEREVARLRGVKAREEVPERLARLDQAVEPLLARTRAVPAWKGGAALRDSMTELARDLEALRKAADLRAVERQVARLARRADQELGQVLVSLAYAASIPSPNSTTLMGGDPSLGHDWGLAYHDWEIRSRTAWGLPSDSRDEASRWHVHGSLLALDLCLGTEALRRLSTDALPAPPTISDDDRSGFREAAVLANAFDYRDEDMALASAAIWRGRLRVASLALDGSQLPDVTAAAGLDETRQELLSWAVVHEPDRVPGFFSFAEFLRLGAEREQPRRAFDAWGASGLSYDGRLSLRFPTSQPFATLAGRRTRGILAGLMPDLALLVAETLHEHRLPAALTRSVLLVATRDYVDRLQLAYDDDWMTLVSEVQRIVPARMDDYLASATTAGPLVPLPTATEDKRP